MIKKGLHKMKSEISITMIHEPLKKTDGFRAHVSLTSVSYTHLDVYKRQAYILLIDYTLHTC